MPVITKKRNWGTAALVEAPIRDAGNVIQAEINLDTKRPLVLKRVKNGSQVWLNGHPFASDAQMLSALARLSEKMDAKVRKQKS